MPCRYHRNVNSPVAALASVALAVISVLLILVDGREHFCETQKLYFDCCNRVVVYVTKVQLGTLISSILYNLRFIVRQFFLYFDLFLFHHKNFDSRNNPCEKLIVPSIICGITNLFCLFFQLRRYQPLLVTTI